MASRRSKTQGTELQGGCYCGKVRYSATGPYDPAHCHCPTCRRTSGAAFLTWVSFRSEDFVFTRERPTVFASSGQVERSFCGTCGTVLTFRQRSKPNEIVVTLCSLDEPEIIAPVAHEWVETQCSWLKFDDGLACYQKRPSQN